MEIHILPKGFISIEKFDGIDKTTLTDTVSGGACKIIVTTDMKAYLTYDFEVQEWKSVDHADLSAVDPPVLTRSSLQASPEPRGIIC